MFIRFLQEKYHNDFKELVEAWGEKDTQDLTDFADVRYPSDKSEAYKKASPGKKADIDAFWQQYQDQAIREEEDENV